MHMQLRTTIQQYGDWHTWPLMGGLLHLVFGLAVWLSGNALASINVVALRQTRLVPGWVTVCGRVNHLGM